MSLLHHRRINMKITFPWYLFCVLVLISCSPGPTEQIENIDIPELKEYYTPLLKEAQKWAADAYLYSVDIPIGKKPWLIYADFYSATKNKESFAITLDLQGKISGQVFSQELEVVQKEPILLSQWKVDSQEALDILMAENTDAINRIRNLCGSIMLTRASPFPEKQLVWNFQPRECGSPDGNIYYLDPLTGETLLH
jgi:hypothetical protein